TPVVHGVGLSQQRRSCQGSEGADDERTKCEFHRTALPWARVWAAESRYAFRSTQHSESELATCGIHGKSDFSGIDRPLRPLCPVQFNFKFALGRTDLTFARNNRKSTTSLRSRRRFTEMKGLDPCGDSFSLRLHAHPLSAVTYMRPIRK